MYLSVELIAMKSAFSLLDSPKVQFLEDIIRDQTLNTLYNKKSASLRYIDHI